MDPGIPPTQYGELLALYLKHTVSIEVTLKENTSLAVSKEGIQYKYFSKQFEIETCSAEGKYSNTLKHRSPGASWNQVYDTALIGIETFIHLVYSCWVHLTILSQPECVHIVYLKVMNFKTKKNYIPFWVIMQWLFLFKYREYSGVSHSTEHWDLNFPKCNVSFCISRELEHLQTQYRW